MDQIGSQARGILCPAFLEGKVHAEYVALGGPGMFIADFQPFGGEILFGAGKGLSLPAFARSFRTLVQKDPKAFPKRKGADLGPFRAGIDDGWQELVFQEV